MGIVLFEHNQKAYDSAIFLMNETGKATVIHPTGTGKSFIGFKLAEQHPDACICWLSPSEYIFRTQIENLEIVSDNYSPENIRFFTYTKLMLMDKEMIDEIQPDYIILDEFHRCGAVEWGKGVKRLLETYPETPVLGLSATNIRYLDNRRDMADELFDGNIASEMTLGEAIVRNILLPPTYVLSVYAYEKELQKLQRRTDGAKNTIVREKSKEKLDELKRAIEKAEGLDVVFQKYMTDKAGKYIAFCADVSHMNEMVANAGKWFSLVDKEPKIYSVYADEPQSDKMFAAFKEDNDIEHLKILFCVDMLNEGVHVEDISGVIMFRPTISPIIYKQQLGRALSASKTKQPVIFDIVNNFDNLYSIDSIENEMKTAITYLHDFGEVSSVVNERFRIIDEMHDCRHIFEELQNTLSMSWETSYAAAREYYDKFGHLDLLHSYRSPNGFRLGGWISNMRLRMKNDQLRDWQISQLNSIGMIWDRNSWGWDQYFNEAEKYYKQFGDLNVKSGYVTQSGFRLGNWIFATRCARKGTSRLRLTEEQIERLNSIGMEWEDRLEVLWLKNYAEAKEYFEKNGHLTPLQMYKTETGFALGRWLQRHRDARAGQQFVNIKLTDERIRLLDGIDMVWDIEDGWEKRYSLVFDYYQIYGNIKIPQDYIVEGIWIGKWLAIQRQIKTGKIKGRPLSDEQVKKLEVLGVEWNYSFADKAWEANFETAVKYFNEFGNLDMKRNFVTTDGKRLGGWLSQQRSKYQKNLLDREKINQLNSIGMVWSSAIDILWEEGYAEAEVYFNTHNNLNVSKNHVSDSGYRLGNWLYRQRFVKNREPQKISTSQIKRLEMLGIDWEVESFTDKWHKRYSCLASYYEKHGNSDVPLVYSSKEDGYLGDWVRLQRTKYKQGNLTEEQIKNLEAVKFKWDYSKADEQWNENFEMAREYFKQHGILDAIVTYVTANGKQLGLWLSKQRGDYRSGKLREDRIERLNSIGMIWEKSANIAVTAQPNIKRKMAIVVKRNSYIPAKERLTNG